MLYWLKISIIHNFIKIKKCWVNKVNHLFLTETGSCSEKYLQNNKKKTNFNILGQWVNFTPSSKYATKFRNWNWNTEKKHICNQYQLFLFERGQKIILIIFYAVRYRSQTWPMKIKQSFVSNNIRRVALVCDNIKILGKYTYCPI